MAQVNQPEYRQASRSRGASFVEVIVVVGIIALLIGILIPTAQAVRHQSFITQCASHLQQLGAAMTMYVDEHRSLPRTTYVAGAPLTAGTGKESADPFGVEGPQANDITASIQLLRRTQKLKADLFVCPFSDPERAIPDAVDARLQSNFSNYRQNLGYSFAVPYPAEGSRMPRVSRLLTKSYILAADINPGLAGVGDNAAMPTLKSPTRLQTMANSANHAKDGQNVLYGDGHVDWVTSAFAGPLEDNIFTNRHNETWTGPVDDLDVMLLPTDD
jgi:prepilin-type processing-associated H-X9-DG protein